MGWEGLLAQFIVSHYKKIGDSIGVLGQPVCLVSDAVAVGSFAFIFGCAPVGQTSGSVAVPTWGLVS